MEIIKVEDRDYFLIEKLCIIWRSSVRITHLFLSEMEIDRIAGYIPGALAEVQELVIAVDDKGEPVAFMGIDEQKLEMLFVSSEMRGGGVGKRLLQYGIDKFSVNELGVNEQNPQAVGFYEYMGFRAYRRTDIDEQGNPYPIVYMKSY